MLNPSDYLEVNLERAAGDVIDGEAIIINLETGVYYSMQGIGGDIWAMIGARRSFGSMLDEIVAHYDVDRSVAQTDLETVAGQLLDEGLIRFTGSGSAYGARNAETKKQYATPQLQVYRDMQDLLALDPPAPGMNQIAWQRSGSK